MPWQEKFLLLSIAGLINALAAGEPALFMFCLLLCIIGLAISK